jgi:hypothetical protein
MLLITGCGMFHKKQTIIEPINVQISDESRVDNNKIRHIFKEFLLKEIVEQGKGWLTVRDMDTLNTEIMDFTYIDYLIIFDIMDYSSVEIEMRTEKLLVSTKIVKVSNRNVMNSYIESAVGRNIEQICQTVAYKITDAVINRLISLHRREIRYAVPETPFEPNDSL